MRGRECGSVVLVEKRGGSKIKQREGRREMLLLSTSMESAFL